MVWRWKMKDETLMKHEKWKMMYRLAVCRLYVIHTPAPGALPIAEDQGFWGGGNTWCFQGFNLCHPPRSVWKQCHPLIILVQRSCFAAYPSISSGFDFQWRLKLQNFPNQRSRGSIFFLSHWRHRVSRRGHHGVHHRNREISIHGRFLECFSGNMWPCPWLPVKVHHDDVAHSCAIDFGRKGVKFWLQSISICCMSYMSMSIRRYFERIFLWLPSGYLT